MLIRFNFGRIALKSDSKTVAHGRKAYFDVQVAKLNIETLEQGLAVHLHEITDKKIKEHQLKGSNEQMDQVIYKTTHDLKAPIVSALALTTLAEEAVVEDKNKYIELIRRSLVKLDTFINEMNSFFRSEKLALRRELIDFDMLIKDELENLNSALLNSRVQISVEKKGSGDFYSDSIRVKTILTNLLSNAIKYSDLKKRVPFIRILVLINEEFCELCVVDNGIGIEPQYQDKIFDLFFRATDQSQGTGLGLFIVRDTVQKLKGTIHVVSTLGEGSTFKVRIPNQIYQPIEVV
jgi:signal transduction histidine kinase